MCTALCLYVHLSKTAVMLPYFLSVTNNILEKSINKTIKLSMRIEHMRKMNLKIICNVKYSRKLQIFPKWNWIISSLIWRCLIKIRKQMNWKSENLLYENPCSPTTVTSEKFVFSISFHIKKLFQKHLQQHVTDKSLK